MSMHVSKHFHLYWRINDIKEIESTASGENAVLFTKYINTENVLKIIKGIQIGKKK